MTSIRTSNKNCRQYVDVRAPFKGNNLEGRWRVTTTVKREQVNLYVVSSFEMHHCLYVYDAAVDKWFETDDPKYGGDIRRHKEQARPTDVPITTVTSDDMYFIYMYGFTALISAKLKGERTAVLFITNGKSKPSLLRVAT